jgi:hypothetical protein
MAHQDKEEARILAERAAVQSKHAMKNTGRAARRAAAHTAERTEDVAKAVAHSASRGAEALAHEAGEVLDETAHVAHRATRNISTVALTTIATDLGLGFLATGVSFASGAYAADKLGTALANTIKLFRRS